MNIFIHQEKSGSNNKKRKEKKQTQLSEIHTQNNDKQNTSVDKCWRSVFTPIYQDNGVDFYSPQISPRMWYSFLPALH